MQIQIASNVLDYDIMYLNFEKAKADLIRGKSDIHDKVEAETQDISNRIIIKSRAT